MRRKILIVDDNAELVKLLRLAFRSAGYSVATAADGIQALKKVKTARPDLIVLDLVLPHVDGFAVCETLRRCARTAPLPVIMLTGLGSQFARLAGLESGGTDFLTKPVSPAELVRKANALLNSPAAAGASAGSA
ncbi:MAG TPA: response regulator [Verrucomicrobiota bacterium]|nr:response regulator [Verrucomicrobiota bacterium]HRT55958.1 response regulator [Candidatus Paceibacterota bacterium]